MRSSQNLGPLRKPIQTVRCDLHLSPECAKISEASAQIVERLGSAALIDTLTPAQELSDFGRRH